MEQEDRQAQVADLFSCIDKLLKGMQLYEGHGPLVDRLMGEVMTRLGAVLQIGALTVRVTPVGLIHDSRPLSEDGKPPRYLFRMFCDGVRELTFLPGLEEDELRSLIDVMRADPRHTDDDLVTLLWRQELKKVRYYAVDTLGVDADEDSEVALSEKETGRIVDAEDGQEMVMSSSDMRVLRTGDQLGWARDCRAPQAAVGKMAAAAERIRSAFTSPRDYLRFVAVAVRLSPGAESPLVLGCLDALIASGDLDGLIELLSAIDQLARQGEQAGALRDAAIHESRILRLVPLYSLHHQALDPVLRRLAEGERREALVTLLKALDGGEAQQTLLTTLGEEGVDMTAFYLRHLESERAEDVVEAIAALGKIGTPRAVKAISEALGNHLTAVRRSALEAMLGRYDPGARVALGRVLKDPNRDNRLLALQILEQSEDRRLGGALLSALQDSNFTNKDEAEQTAFFKALAAFQDARTLRYLGGVLQQKNLTRSRMVTDQQLLAIQAIGAMSVPEAREILERASASWYLSANIKQAAQAVLSRMPRS